MELLVLGGTAFLGRAIATDAAARGHGVTCLARGSADPPVGVAFVRSDRDADDGLAAVGGARWDAVVDVSRQPGQVRRAVRDLDADLFVLVSTGNVYAAFDAVEQSETAPLRGPLTGDVMTSMEFYGEAKVACEQAVLSRPGASAVIRSGLIGGPGDWSGRSGYWPWRFAHPTGADVLVPDDPGFPVAIIDVRDLAAWIVTVAERRSEGVYNATGPTTTLADALAVAATAARGSAPPRPVTREQLAAAGVEAWTGPRSMPLWIDDPEWRGFATLDTARARAAGLRTRPLVETFADVIPFEETRTERPAGLSDDDERALRAGLDDEGPGWPVVAPRAPTVSCASIRDAVEGRA